MIGFRSILRGSVLSLFRCQGHVLRQNVLWNLTERRPIFTAYKLGVENFKRERKNYYDRLGALKDKYEEEVKAKLDSENPVVHSTDLKAIIHLADDKEDLNLVIRMIKVFSTQTGMISSNQFSFGPLVMRLLYDMKETQKALDLFNDPEIKDGFFDQIISITILCQMLFEDGRYDEVHNVMQQAMKRFIGGVKYPYDCLVLVAAACLKQNTSESQKKLMDYFHGALDSQVDIPHRALLIGALLCLKQKKYEDAYKLLQQMQMGNRLKSRQLGLLNVELLYCAKIKSFKEAFELLGDVIHEDVPDEFKAGREIFQCVFDEIKAGVEASESKELQHDVKRLEKELTAGYHLIDVDLEKFLFNTIYSKRLIQDGYKQRSFMRKRTMSSRRALRDNNAVNYK